MLHLGPLLICLLDNDSILTLKTASLGDEPVSSFQLDEGFKANCMTHLDTYVNKILIGGENGKLELRNFITGEKLYLFLNNWSSSIRHLEPAPALDVVGISLSNGYGLQNHSLYNPYVFLGPFCCSMFVAMKSCSNLIVPRLKNQRLFIHALL